MSMMMQMPQQFPGLMNAAAGGQPQQSILPRAIATNGMLPGGQLPANGGDSGVMSRPPQQPMPQGQPGWGQGWGATGTGRTLGMPNVGSGGGTPPGASGLMGTGAPPNWSLGGGAGNGGMPNGFPNPAPTGQYPPGLGGLGMGMGTGMGATGASQQSMPGYGQPAAFGRSGSPSQNPMSNLLPGQYTAGGVMGQNGQINPFPTPGPHGPSGSPMLPRNTSGGFGRPNPFAGGGNMGTGASPPAAPGGYPGAGTTPAMPPGMNPAQQNAQNIYQRLGLLGANSPNQSPQMANNIWQQTGQFPSWWNQQAGMNNQQAAAENAGATGSQNFQNWLQKQGASPAAPAPSTFGISPTTGLPWGMGGPPAQSQQQPQQPPQMVQVPGPGRYVQT